MDDETRAAFARMEHWFELGQSRHVELVVDLNRKFGDIDGHFVEIDRRFNSVEGELSGLRHELHRFRDWTALQFADVRSSINQLSRRFEVG